MIILLDEHKRTSKRSQTNKQKCLLIPAYCVGFTHLLLPWKRLHQAGVQHSNPSRLGCQRQLSQGFWADLTFCFHQGGTVLLFTPSLPPLPPCYHVLMGVWSWSFPLPTVVLKLVQFVDLSESFLSFLPVKQLNLIPWWASTFPSPCMTRTGHGKALFKAMRQQSNISTTFDTRGTLLSGLNMATYSRCPWDTWIHQH